MKVTLYRNTKERAVEVGSVEIADKQFVFTGIGEKWLKSVRDNYPNAPSGQAALLKFGAARARGSYLFAVFSGKRRIAGKSLWGGFYDTALGRRGYRN